MNITGAVNANTAYCNGELIAQDVVFTLPEVTPVMADIQAMGTMSLPVRGMFDEMESTIKKIGIDKGLSKLLTLESKTIEYRWTQQITKEDGTTKIEGCKAFLRGVPKMIMPGFDVEPGSAIECEIPIAVTRYQLFVGGEEYICIDRLTQVCNIKGKDYYNEISSLL